MDKKLMYNIIYKNRFLIICCVMLISGTVTGMSMLEFTATNISENLFNFISRSSSDVFNIFINRFSFPFLILLGIYFSGTSILGIYTAPLLIFINGFFFGFENALNYSYIGIEYTVNALIIFFTSTLFLDFMLLIMSENSIFTSKKLINSISNVNSEKCDYKAKKLCVKFIAFTAVFAIISLFSAYFYKFIQSIL